MDTLAELKFKFWFESNVNHWIESKLTSFCAQMASQLTDLFKKLTDIIPGFSRFDPILIRGTPSETFNLFLKLLFWDKYKNKYK